MNGTKKNSAHQIVVTKSQIKNSTTSPCGSFYTVSNAELWFLLLRFLLIRGAIKEKTKKGAKKTSTTTNQFWMKWLCFVFLVAFKYRFHVLFYTSNVDGCNKNRVCYYCCGCCCRCCCVVAVVDLAAMCSHNLPPAFVSITPLFDVYLDVKWCDSIVMQF